MAANYIDLSGATARYRGAYPASIVQSIWERDFHSRSGGADVLPDRADLLVVGAGIVGLFTALHYKRKHPAQRVLVVERGPWPSGASVKNAGFACFGSPSELLHDLDAEGEDAMLARVEERWRGLLELRAELGDAAIAFEPSGGHELFRMDDPLYSRVADRFTELNKMLAAIFSREAFRWDDALIGHYRLKGIGHIARNDLEGPIDTGRMIQALLERARAEGIAIAWNTNLMRIEEEGDHAMALTSDGRSVRASRIVIATNGYARELLPGIDVKPARGQVLLTSPIEGLLLKGTFHLDEGFYYFRDFDGRILLGGGRNLDFTGESTSEDRVTEKIQGALEALLREVILPGRSFTIEQRWSGIMGFREKGKTPLIEHVSSHVIAAVGLSGMGVAIGVRVARKAAVLAGE